MGACRWPGRLDRCGCTVSSMIGWVLKLLGGRVETSAIKAVSGVLEQHIEDKTERQTVQAHLIEHEDEINAALSKARIASKNPWLYSFQIVAGVCIDFALISMLGFWLVASFGTGELVNLPDDFLQLVGASLGIRLVAIAS